MSVEVKESTVVAPAIGVARLVVRAVVAGGLAIVVFLVAAVAVTRGPIDDVPGNTSRPPVDSFVGPAAASGSLDAAIASLRERVRSQPDDARAFAALGLAYLQRALVTADPAWYESADAALARSLELQPAGNADGVLGLATLAAARHDFEGALRLGREAHRLAPDDGAPYGVIGDALLELGRYGAAVRTFQSMVDTEPGLASYARASYARELTGDLEGALDAMRAARSVAGTQVDAAWAAAHVGELELKLGRTLAASRSFIEASTLAPESVLAEVGLAKIDVLRGDLERAAESLESVVARFPSPGYAWMLGDVYTLLGDRDAASTAYALVRVQARLAEASGVNTDLEIALFEAERGDPADALRAARAEWRRRASVHVADALAWALHANGRLSAAATFADRAMALGTADGSILYHAGAIAFARGRFTEAERLLGRALAVDPVFSVLGARDAARLLERAEAR